MSSILLYFCVEFVLFDISWVIKIFSLIISLFLILSNIVDEKYSISAIWLVTYLSSSLMHSFESSINLGYLFGQDELIVQW